MIYTELTKKALRISFNAHKDQVDKTGMPYVYHPFVVAEGVEDKGEYAVCVALLHDVVEDTDTTLDDLRAEGFPNEVVEAIGLLTHDDAVPYEQYLHPVKANPIAKAVKMSDLRHNMNLDRLDKVDDKALKRLAKYRNALDFLMSVEE